MTLLEVICVSIGGTKHDYVRAQFMYSGGKGGVIRGWRPHASKVVIAKHPLLWDLVKESWDADASKRPSFIEIVDRIDAACGGVLAQLSQRHSLVATPSSAALLCRNSSTLALEDSQMEGARDSA